MLFLGVPVWSGERIGVDHDRDGWFDGDEMAAGSDPTDPDSNNDGFWDLCDCTAPPPGCAGQPTPQVILSSVKGWLVTTNVFKLTYETDGLSSTRIEFGPDSNYGFFSGESQPLPAGSNHWKTRHTVFLRLDSTQGLLGLDDGSFFAIQILTEGQNGSSGQSGNITLVDSAIGPIPIFTVADNSDPNIRVGDLVVTAQRNGAMADYTAVVTIIDNDGVVQQGIEVAGRYTYFDSLGNITQEFPALAITDLAGQVTLPGSALQSVGDRTVFDLPMSINGGSSVKDPAVALKKFFAWPEGPSNWELTAP